MKVLFVVTGLLAGGAETMMTEVALRGKRDGHEAMVVSLTGDEPLGARLREAGIPVHALGLSFRFPNPLAVFRIAKIIKSFQPDLVQTWMYHSDLLGSLATLLAGWRTSLRPASGRKSAIRKKTPLLWAIHHAADDPETLAPRTRWVLKLNARLSHWLPDKIICCAESARDTHVAAGYRADKMTVIPNGVDVNRFRPNPAAREEVRRELGLAPDTFLVGLCARFHPAKDHLTFIYAASFFHKDNPEAHFLLTGANVTRKNFTLRTLLDLGGLSSHSHLLGLRADLPRLLPALDVLVSSSRSEAFPLIIVEAMACGVPCVVTDVGDSALIVGETGRVVPAENPTEMAAALQWSRGRRLGELGQLARKRVESLYNLDLGAARYWKTYEEIRVR
ncbi:MAG: glycosyltransferase [Chloroflexota bacterium]